MFRFLGISLLSFGRQLSTFFIFLASVAGSCQSLGWRTPCTAKGWKLGVTVCGILPWRPLLRVPRDRVTSVKPCWRKTFKIKAIKNRGVSLSEDAAKPNVAVVKSGFLPSGPERMCTQEDAVLGCNVFDGVGFRARGRAYYQPSTGASAPPIARIWRTVLVRRFA